MKYKEIKVNGRKLRVEIIKGFFGRFRGFMFSLSKKPLLFEFKQEGDHGIHMFFVFQPLLVIWFDSEMKETYRVQAMPFGIYNYKSKKKAKYILELPLGS